MSESIFEHTTSIAGLTCKPLAILSETISSEEMSIARGGNEGESTMFELMVSNSDEGNQQTGDPTVCQSNPNCYDEKTDGGSSTQSGTLLGGSPPSLYGGYGGSGGGGDDEGDNDDSSWLEDIWDWLTDEDEEDEDDNGSGLDGMEGDFDPSQDEMLV